MSASPRTGSKQATGNVTEGEDRRGCVVCGARLSSYNENETCWAHTLELPWKGPGTRPR